MLGPYLGLWHRQLIAGFGAGLILGDIPTVFFVGAFFGSEIATAFIEKVPVWLTNGFAAAGRAMPALGVAILLNYLPITKQWYFAIMGFILVCFLNLPMIAVGLIGLITAIIYVELYHKNDGAKVNNMERF